MKKNKLRWYVADKEYVKYLRQFEDKVENIEYNEKLKPYIGIVININGFDYYVPISSVKQKHYKMSDRMDFIKIMQKEKIIGVLNLNNMIPISDNNVKQLKYEHIEEYRDFKTEEEKRLYISFLSFELSLINKNTEKIIKNATNLYNEKISNKNSNISKRCCDFKLLEKKSILYKNFNQNN